MVKELIRFLKERDIVFIQTHNFPDHDAVASAFGLQDILAQKGIEANIIYDGEIQRESLSWMIEALGIIVEKADHYPVKETDSIIIVDGCKGNKNVTDLIGEEVAIIDHHITESPDDVWYADIRPEYGSCASIIAEYYKELELVPNREVATSFIIAIDTDTHGFRRECTVSDIDAFRFVFDIADRDLSSRILRNNITVDDLEYFKYITENAVIEEPFAFCYFENGCAQNLMGILGNFMLTIRQVQFVAIFADNKNKINMSLRSENERWNASKIANEILDGIGFGGGHGDMAGGIITQTDGFDPLRIRNRIAEILKRDEK
jgi:nanoRNase/pAp phosphatase (c-di-AMP/oligoRNAs hydrolase)